MVPSQLDPMNPPPDASSGNAAFDCGEASGRLGVFVAACLLALAIPGALVLREMSEPTLKPLAQGSPSSASSPNGGPSALASSASVPPNSLPSVPASASPPAPQPVSPAPSLPSLANLVLAAEPGFTVSVDSGGQLVAGTTTLGLCGARFASESKRLARLAVSYKSSQGLGPSVEVVSYAPGGADLAYSELLDAVHHCPHSYGDGHINIIETTAEPPDPTLLPSQLAVVQLANRDDGTTVWTAEIYQFDSPYLVVAYSNPFTTEQAAYATVLLLARREAPVLQRAANAVPTIALNG